MFDINETNFMHKLLLTGRQVSSLRKAFASNSSVNIKLSKTQLSEIIQLGGFLCRLLGLAVKVSLTFMKNVITALSKSVLIPLGLAAATATDAEIHKKILGSRRYGSLTTTLIISNKEMEYIMEIVKSLEKYGLLIKGMTKTIENETKNKEADFLVVIT